jgi:hypothetical protein
MVSASFRFVTYLYIYLRFEMEVKGKNKRGSNGLFSACTPSRYGFAGLGWLSAPFLAPRLVRSGHLKSIVLKAQGRMALIPVISQKSTNAGYRSSP